MLFFLLRSDDMFFFGPACPACPVAPADGTGVASGNGTGTQRISLGPKFLNRLIHEYDINYRKPKTLSKSTKDRC